MRNSNTATAIRRWLDQTLAAMHNWSQNDLEIYEYWQIRDADDRRSREAKMEKVKAEKIPELKESSTQTDRNAWRLKKMDAYGYWDYERAQPPLTV